VEWELLDGIKKKFNKNKNDCLGLFSDNQSTPKSGHIDVSNAFNGPWLKVKDFTCALSRMFYEML